MGLPCISILRVVILGRPNERVHRFRKLFVNKERRAVSNILYVVAANFQVVTSCLYVDLCGGVCAGSLFFRSTAAVQSVPTTSCDQSQWDFPTVLPFI